MCLSNGSTPVRLSRDESDWELELYQLARVDDGVYRPRRFRLAGPLAILTYLRANDPTGSLTRITARLFRRLRNRNCHFVAVNGGWIPTERPAPTRDEEVVGYRVSRAPWPR